MADVDLGVLQRWMQSAVTTPGGVREGLRVARETYALDIADAVKGSNRLSAPARLEIYARGYVLRLLECLRAEFPILLALVGDQVFEMFASSYVWSRPSRSSSLYALGAGFADFLQSTRPDSTQRRERSKRSRPISPAGARPRGTPIGRVGSKTIILIMPPMRSR